MQILLSFCFKKPVTCLFDNGIRSNHIRGILIYTLVVTTPYTAVQQVTVDVKSLHQGLKLLVPFSRWQLYADESIDHIHLISSTICLKTICFDAEYFQPETRAFLQFKCTSTKNVAQASPSGPLRLRLRAKCGPLQLCQVNQTVQDYFQQEEAGTAFNVQSKTRQHIPFCVHLTVMNKDECFLLDATA